MNQNILVTKARKNAISTGICFIVAAISSIIGLLLYEPVLVNPNYLVLGAKASNQVVWGAVCELILCVSAIGTAISLYPQLRKYNEALGLGYVIFRTLEVVFIMIGIISVLGLVSLSQHFSSVTNPDLVSFYALCTLLKGMHDWTFILGPNFMLGVNTFCYSYIFYRSGLLPKAIAVLGITSATLIFLAAFLELFGIIKQVSTLGFILAFPIFINEMTVAIRLLLKGFNFTNLE